MAISEQVFLDIASTARVPKALHAGPSCLPPAPRIAALAEVARHPSHTGRVHDALDRIEASCRQPLSLADLADCAGFSPFHFLRVFRRVTGTTPHQYLIGARLRLAIRMLLDTDRPVTEVAYEVGFQDLSNFVRTFHRVVGCSPSTYRRHRGRRP